MPYKIIVEECTSCAACEPVCPNVAIAEKKSVFRIDADSCTECDGEAPQCLEVCPIDGCVVVDESRPRYEA